MNASQLEGGTEVSSPEQSVPEIDSTGSSADGSVAREGSTPGRDSSAGIESVSLDSVFGILSNRRRRWAIAYLNGNDDERVELRDLAEQIAAWENGVPVENVTYKQRKRVYTSLYQSHLKKMDRMGIVQYDQDRGTVEPTPSTRQIEAYLDVMSDDGISREFVPVGAAAVCIAFVVVAWTGLLPVVSPGGFVVASVVASAFLLVSGVRTIDDRRRY